MPTANPAATGNPPEGNPTVELGSSGEHATSPTTNLADNPDFRAWQSNQDQRAASLQRQLERTEQERVDLESRLDGLFQTLRDAPDGTALEEVADHAAGEYADRQAQRNQQAFAAQGAILQHIQQGVPIEVFDALLAGATPPSQADIARATASHYEAQGTQARADAQAEIKALRDQVAQEIQEMRAAAGLDTLHGGRATGGDPSSQEVMRRQYQERLGAIPASRRQQRINLRREFRQRGLDI
jgi:hypothetical protein